MQWTRKDLQKLTGAMGAADNLALDASLPPPDGHKGPAKIWEEATITKWLHAMLLEPAKDIDDLKAQKIEAEVRAKRLQGDRLQIDIDESLKRTISADEVVDYGRGMASYVRSQCQTLGASVAVRCAALTDARQVQDVIDERMRGILDGLAQWSWDVADFRGRNQPLTDDAEEEGKDEDEEE